MTETEKTTVEKTTTERPDEGTTARPGVRTGTDTTQLPPSEGEGVAPRTHDQDEPETFDRPYVERLREESAAHRVKARRADELAHRLVTALAAGTGKLADARDLPYGEHLVDDDGLPDFDKVADAIDDLIRERPHLASRRPTGSVEQGVRADEQGVSLLGLLRGAG